MSIKITEYSLLPVRRDGQQATITISSTSSAVAVGGGSGGGTSYVAGTNIGISGSTISVCGTVADSARLAGCLPNDITSNLTSGQVLYYDGVTIRSCVGGGGGGSLDALSDVVIATPALNQLLQYNGSTWCNTAVCEICANLTANQVLYYNGTTICSTNAITGATGCFTTCIKSAKICSPLITGGTICATADVCAANNLRAVSCVVGTRICGTCGVFGTCMTTATGCITTLTVTPNVRHTSISPRTTQNAIAYFTSDGCLLSGVTTAHCHCDLYNSTSVKACTTSTGLCICGCGFATDFVASSDLRYKQDISPIYNALSIVNKLQGVEYKLCADKKGICRIGLIAQDVQKVVPEVVIKDENGMLGITYEKLVPVLIEAIKMLQREINILKCY